nr:phosphatidylinositol 3-kinase, root isoform [Tanacetum cinerariifolium]
MSVWNSVLRFVNIRSSSSIASLEVSVEFHGLLEMGPIQRLATQSANKYADHNGMSILNVMVEPKDRSENKVPCEKGANHPTDLANTTLFALAFCNMYLHNLLLRDDGCLFHVDFGYNLGRDPMSFPPPMKLYKEIQEAMGEAERCSYGFRRSFGITNYYRMAIVAIVF